ncbi:hypothetical protein RD149_16040 [Gordonia westfalica]|uniref:Uncharacterized protein n=1 Tax=Gordonia westfalica TaxID=158898 RepID=A0ABU2GUY1_9ACTN|nr:hypothetical protein [Gordonia westfalica]MDS1115271.1 hypothetical protein [Gordonia westfalica]
MSEHVTEFIADYARFREVDSSSVVDLWARAGHMLPALAAHLEPDISVGFCDDPDVMRGLVDLYPTMHWRVAEPDSLAVAQPDAPGVVVGMPPWHWAPRRLSRRTDDGDIVQIADDPANVAIIDICRSLDHQGLGFFVVGPGFLLRPGASTTMARLAEFDLHIDGVIELPRGAIRPDHGAAQLVLVLGRQKQIQPLFGKMSLIPGAFTTLLATQAWLEDSPMLA